MSNKTKELLRDILEIMNGTLDIIYTNIVKNDRAKDSLRYRIQAHLASLDGEGEKEDAHPHCASCGEHHPADVMCPPHEVRSSKACGPECEKLAPQPDLPELPEGWRSGALGSHAYQMSSGWWRGVDLPQVHDLANHAKKLHVALTAALAREKEQREIKDVTYDAYLGEVDMHRETKQERDTLRAKLDEAEKLLRNLSYDAEPGNEATFEALEESLAEAHIFLSTLKSAPEPAKPKSLCEGTGKIGGGFLVTKPCPGPTGGCEDPCHAKPERAECDGSGWVRGPVCGEFKRTGIRRGCDCTRCPGCRKCRPCKECGGSGNDGYSRELDDCMEPIPYVCEHCNATGIEPKEGK